MKISAYIDFAFAVCSYFHLFFFYVGIVLYSYEFFKIYCLHFYNLDFVSV